MAQRLRAPAADSEDPTNITTHVAPVPRDISSLRSQQALCVYTTHMSKQVHARTHAQTRTHKHAHTIIKTIYLLKIKF